MVNTGEGGLRLENFERAVKGFALQEFKLLQICKRVSTDAWTQTYQVETSTELTGGLGSTIQGVPRLAAFPYGQVTWTETSKRLLKHGMDGVVSWEDFQTSKIDVLARTLLRVARAVAKSVDDAIYTQLSADVANSLAITAGQEWDSATVANRDPIQNILDAMRLVWEDQYDIQENGFLLVNPKDYANLIGNANVRNAGQFYSSDVTKNGRVGRLLGLTVIVTTAVTADECMVVKGQEACTWYEAKGLTVSTIEDPGIKFTVRAYQVGVPVMTATSAAAKITNTAA